MKWHPSEITRTWIPRETAPATKSEEKRMFSQVTRIGEVKTSIDNTTGQRSLFLDSNFFFNSTRALFFDSNFRISTRVFFFRSWTYILQISTHIFYCIPCILQVSTYVLCFQHVFTIGIVLSATERHTFDYECRIECVYGFGISSELCPQSSQYFILLTMT